MEGPYTAKMDSLVIPHESFQCRFNTISKNICFTEKSNFQKESTIAYLTPNTTLVTFKFTPKIFTKTYSIKALCQVHKDKKTNQGQKLFSMQKLCSLVSSYTAHLQISHQSAPKSLELAQETFAGPLAQFGSCANNAVPSGFLFSNGQNKGPGGSGAVGCPQ